LTEDPPPRKTTGENMYGRGKHQRREKDDIKRECTGTGCG